MAITTHACKLNTNTAIKFISSCSSVLHAYISTTRRQPTKSSHGTRYLHCHKLFSINRNLCCHCRAVCGRAFCQGLSSKKTLSTSASLADGEIMEQQFEEFKQLLEDSGNVRERLRIIVADLDSVTRVMQADLLQVHYSSRSPEILKKAKSHIGKLKELYGQLAEVIKGTPGQYYRYHEHWRNQTNTVVFLIVYLHWLETGNLLSYAETQNTLGLNPDEFGLDIEDYLIGLCNMSSELPRYVVNQVTIGDYECPKKVSKFLSDLYAAFRILNLRNDFLRKRFDGMKYDLKKVEEVLYDVKIRKLGSSGSATETKHEAS